MTQRYAPAASQPPARHEELPSRGQATTTPARISLNRPIAIFLWSVACVTTYELIVTLRPDLDLWKLIAAAIAAQVIFTWLEKPVLRGKPNQVSSAVLLLDTLTNAGGIFPMALRAPETPPAQMLIAAFNLAPTMPPLGALLLSLILGFLLAAAPEAVWRWKE